MEKINWRHQYDEVTDTAVKAIAQLDFPFPSLTVQSYTDQVDLNTVLKRFGVDDMTPLQMASFDNSILGNPELFGDFTGERNVDLRGALEIAQAATESFNALPARIRRKFDNDPRTLHDWLLDKNNVEEAVTLGLLTKQAEPEAELGSEKRPFWTKWTDKPAATPPTKTP